MTKSAAPAPTVDRITVVTSPEMRRDVEELARKHQRSLAGEIRRALDAWIERCAAEEGPQS